MSLKEKREARRARENEILRQMAEENAVREDGGAVENAEAEETREAEAVRDEAAADETGKAAGEVSGANAASEAAEKPADKAAGPSYTPMTDEQIRKVRLILWPILFVIAIVVYFVMRSCKG